MKNVDPHFKRDFERRLDTWISKQGVFFQLSHATTFNEVLRGMFDLCARVVVVLLILLLVAWFYLSTRVSTDGYKAKLQSALIEGTRAKDGKIQGVSRQKTNLIAANLKIADIELNGSEDSFFEQGSEEAPGLSALGVIVSPLSVLDGTFYGWRANALTVETLDIQLKTGAETDEQAKAIYQQLFKKHEHLELREIDVARANIKWGYTESTKGSLIGASVSAQYGREGWRISAEGGKFSYGFIQDADVEKFDVVCDEDGVHVREAILRVGDGMIEFNADLSVEGNPRIEGDITIQHLSLEKVLTEHQQKWLGGYISAEGKISGRTYNGAGPEFDLNVLLKRNDDVVLEGKFPVLASLELVDTLNSYQRVKFGAGSFKMKKEGETLSISKINLRAGILMYLTGDLVVTSKHREPVMVQQGGDAALTDGLELEDAPEDQKKESEEDGSISLADAIKAGESLEDEAREVLVLPGGDQAYVTGDLRVSLNNSVFDKVKALKDEFSMDEEKKRYHIDLEIDSFMEEIGASVAKKMDAIQKASLSTKTE